MPAYRKIVQLFVPVVDRTSQPLMPTTIVRARHWISSGKATPFLKKGVFCVRLNVKPSNDNKQDIAVGIDPGSKREGYTVKAEAHTYLNILAETPDWVSKAVEVRRNMRRARRFRKTRRRSARFNNRRGTFLPPSIKARWQFKLNICKFLLKVLPITHFIAEDIKAKTWKKARKWNKSFSPLEVGKKWFYDELGQLGILDTKRGYETKELRDSLGLKKSNSKLADKFECHNIDSWVLANSVVGGHDKPDNTTVVKITPIRFFRRQLHMFQPAKGGKRRRHGGTRSLGFKRGSLVKHKKLGACYVGGTMNGRISLHCTRTGKRLTQKAKVEDCRFRSFHSFRTAGANASSC